jgi:hypothetical protein
MTMFHVPAHKNTQYPAGQVTLHDLHFSPPPGSPIPFEGHVVRALAEPMSQAVRWANYLDAVEQNVDDAAGMLAPLVTGVAVLIGIVAIVAGLPFLRLIAG